MEANNAKLSNIKSLELYVFLSSFAVNLFLGTIIIINKLSIPYFFYATQTTIHITILSPLGDILTWIVSTWLLYATKETTKSLQSPSLTNKFLNLALIGSYLLTASIILGRFLLPEIGATNEPFLAQIQFWMESTGILLLFIGSMISLFASILRSRDILPLFFFYVFSILIPLEIWALIHWGAYPFDPVSYQGLGWKGAFIELQLFYTMYPLVFWLFLVFLFSWIWAPAIKFIKTKVKLGWNLPLLTWLQNPTEEKISLSNRTVEGYSKSNSDGDSLNSSVAPFVPKIILLVSLFLGAFVAYYPNLSSRVGFVGWDMLGYYELLIRMTEKGVYPALQLAFSTDRPGYFLLLYLLKSGTTLPSTVVIEFMPMVTIVANALAIFLFVKVGRNSTLLASIAAILTIFSFNTTIAMYTGTLANWLAMALGFIFFALFLKVQKNKSKKYVLATIFVSAMILLVHYWTWAIFSLIIGCYMFLSLFERKKKVIRLVIVAVLLASAIVAVFFFSDVIQYFFGSYGLTENMGGQLGALSLFWTKLQILINYWFSGTLANPVMLILALVGIGLAFNQRTAFNRLVISWVILGSLLLIFTAPIGRNMNQWLIWRAMYVIPFQIPAALGLYFVLSKLELWVHKSKNSDSGGIDAPRTGFLHLARNENFIIISLLVIDYAFLAFLLFLDFNAFIVLLLLNYFVLTVFIHLKIRKTNNDKAVLFLFTVIVMLFLLNYTLRSLAPLAL